MVRKTSYYELRTTTRHFDEDGGGVGLSEYDVLDHTFMFCRLVFTSIFLVRFSGSGFFE